MFIDSHAHLTLHEELEDELKRASQVQVQAIIDICTDEKTLMQGLKLQETVTSPKIHLAASTTPHDVAKDGEHFFPIVERYAMEKKLVAIGETGLDYYYEHSPKELQKIYLEKYLKLAKQCNLPVVIHCRDAFEDFFSIYDEVGKGVQGVLHCFTGTLEEAKEGLERGFYISFSGIVTFPKSVELKEVAKFVPMKRLLVETDSPYLAPNPYRGKKNEPAYIIETAKVVAELKGSTVEELGATTSDNAKQLFRV
jgi:TatD DNase family protein